MQQVSSSTLPVVAAEKKAGGALWSWAGAIIVVAAVVAPLLLHKYAPIDPELLATFGYAAVFILGVVGSVTFFLPIPVLTVVFAGATMLNPFLLSLSAAAGITLGMAACYAMGKAGHRIAQHAQPDSNSKFYRISMKVSAWYTANVTTASFVIAATPNPVFDYAGYLAGLTGVSRSRFLLATFAGKMVQCMVVAMLGYYAFDQISGWI